MRQAAALWDRWRAAEERWGHRFQDAFCWWLSANRDPAKHPRPITRAEVFAPAGPVDETPLLSIEEQRAAIETWERHVQLIQARRVSNG